MRIPSFGVTGVAIAAAVCISCGSDNPTPAPTTTSVGTIAISGQNGTQAFTPNPASFGGQTVVFKNNDSVTHRVILNDASVDTGDIAPGATSRQVTMPSSGTNYHCSIHAGMIGSISAAGGAPAPPCEGVYCAAY